MISRHWKGIARREFADGYVDHLRCETFPQLAVLPGFIRASILRREVPDGIEFQVVTLWDSLSAIEVFAGLGAQQIVRVPELLLGVFAPFLRLRELCEYRVRAGE